MSRIAHAKVKTLDALLQAKHSNGKCMPFIDLVMHDLYVLYMCKLPKLEFLANPHVDASEYWSLLKHFPEQ